MSSFKALMISLLGKILPARIRNALLHLSFHLARPEFNKFAYQYNFAADMNLGLTAMAKRGFAPRTIVDVGAFNGDWSRLARRIWPQSRLIMVEPNAQNHALLADVAKDIDATLVRELLGARDGETVQFNVMGSGSSIMSERSAVARTVETRQLRSLDSILSGLECPGLLKIDA
jgi:FkbM family methyltransferase